METNLSSSTDRPQKQVKNVQTRYRHSVDEAGEYLRLTLERLVRHRLPADPVNYAVWYEYVSRMNPELKSTIEKSLSKPGNAISAEMTSEWFLEHVVYGGLSLLSLIKSDLLNVMKEIFGDLRTAANDVTDFGKTLSQFPETLEGVNDKKSFQECMKGLLLEVKQIEKSNASFKQSLEMANTRVDELQQKLEEAEKHASTDTLTSLDNRRSFEEKLNHHMNQACSMKTDLTLAIFDIDHFKSINDTYGHLTGDDFLRIVAKTLKDHVKGRDVVCRYGGEEFVVMFPDTPLNGAAKVSVTIIKRFSQMSWKQKNTGVSMGKVTLSAGVAAYRPGESAEAFIQRADVSLYQSKKGGRNRVTVENGDVFSG